jgi:hypothetical protein
MTDMLNNPWVTGIGGGIISSLIVFFVTRYFFSKREKREYLQKLETANNEILYSIRPLVIEKRIPSKDILNAIRVSTAKRYGVKQEDLYNEYSLSYNLINEIMGNSFLSSDQKIEFCNLLNSMKQQEIGNAEKEVEVIYLNEKDSISSKYNSILLAMTTFAMVLTMSLFISKTVTDSSSIEILTEKFPFLAIMTLIPIMAVTLLYTLRLFRDKERERQKLPDKIGERKEKEDEKNVA